MPNINIPACELQELSDCVAQNKKFYTGMFAFSSQIPLPKVCESKICEFKSGHTFGHCVITSYGHVVRGYSEQISDGSQTQLLWS
jgi:succinate-acetate transporter protein